MNTYELLCKYWEGETFPYINEDGSIYIQGYNRIEDSVINELNKLGATPKIERELNELISGFNIDPEVFMDNFTFIEGNVEFPNRITFKSAT